jgi:hypothetical protein
MWADALQLELFGGYTEARALIEGAGRGPRVAPDAQRTMGRCVSQKRVEHGRSGPPATGEWRCRHAAYAPTAGLSIGCDEPDGDEPSSVEGANRECTFRLLPSDLLDRLVRT